MSTSPSIPKHEHTTLPQSSPPLSVTNETAPRQLVVPMPVLQQHDDIFYYVFVKGSLYSPDSAVFGLEAQEIQALAKRFNSSANVVENGIMFKVRHFFFVFEVIFIFSFILEIGCRCY